jgi:DNA-binding MarR family transcriptional regulator
MKSKGIGPPVLTAIESLQRLTELFAQRREQLARGAGLTVAQWQALEQISDEHFMPSLFARERRSTPAAVSKILRQLLDKGLVRTRISRTDGRQRRYRLTAKGERVMDALREARHRAIEAIWLNLRPGPLDAFTRFADELITRLESYSGQRD